MEVIHQVEFRHADVDTEYREKWNIGRLDDFIYLYLNGVKISDTLYRVGGLGGKWVDGYMQLIKHVEDYYPDSITTDIKRKPHLDGRWCIINEQGVEKVVIDTFKYLYLIGGQIYTSDNKFYNIETGVLYCKSYTSMESNEFLFLDNAYDDNKAKRGVLKINKKDGTYEMFPKK